MKENYVPDDVLASILDNMSEGRTATIENVETTSAIGAKKLPQPSQFVYLTNAEIDDLAMNTCKEKNHKQTIWGAKLFRG